ncbi:MAG: CDP-alcohol phosphatidyltransferase family protein [Granulosicoccus sp.]
MAKPASAYARHTAAGSDTFTTPVGTAITLVLISFFILVILLTLSIYLTPFGISSALTSLFLWSIIAILVWSNRRHHLFANFGSANVVTSTRAAITALMAGFIPIAAQIPSDAWLWTIALVATITLCLDGLDGYLARKSNLCSEFGSRFDMEIDALLALVITLFIWQTEKVGIWILALGLMRYLFLGAAIWLDFLKAPLYPSMRRKTLCVVQVGALCLMLCPLLSASQLTIVGAIALAGLTASFAIDVLWLSRQHTIGSNRHK